MNPLTIWFKWFIKKHWLELKHSSKHLRIDYLAEISHCEFENYNTIYKNSRLLHCKLGAFTYVAKESQIQYAEIGKFCSIGPGVKIGFGLHPSSEFVSSHPLFYSTSKQAQLVIAKENKFEEYKTTYIGNDVWIGSNSIIKDGIRIGNGALIGAGAVVTKDVPAYAIVGGVPAQLIRYRFSEEQISFLEKFQWWNKDLKWIKENRELFLDVGRFVREAR
jgi:acetyltransferase-like isoleucine patch superfamily enzyme